MKILVFDQASKNTAFSVGKNGKLADYGMLYAEGEKEERIYNMATQIKSKIKKVKPDMLIIEGIQLQAGNVKTYQMLAWLQGMIIYIAKESGVDYKIVPPITWKSEIGINTKHKRDEQKKECIRLMQDKYGINLKGNDDLADSLGILTYAFKEN